MDRDNRMLWLIGLLGLGAWLWFTRPGRQVAAQTGAAISRGIERVIDLANSTLQLIKRFEGFSPSAYPDAKGFSIGYGHFIQPGEEHLRAARLTEPQAYELLRADVRKYAQAVRDAVRVPLTQNQFDALVSFAYNVGIGAFQRSTLLRKLNSGDYAGAADEFRRWNRSQGQVLAALSERREAERALFLTPDTRVT